MLPWPRETVDEMYRGEFDTDFCSINLDIEDTGGNYFQVGLNVGGMEM